MNKRFVLLLALLFLLTSCNKEGESKVNYTLNLSLLSSPKAWNPHNWETSDENFIPSYTTMGFYQVGLNEERNGYTIYNEMALSAPRDAKDKVTSEDKKLYGYTGQIADGYVYDIDLNPNACFEDGTPINASDYVESMKLLLNPEMVNFRADSFYASNVVLANAEKYFKQGKMTIEALFPYLKESTDGNPTNKNIATDGNYFLNLGAVTSFYRVVSPTATSDGSFYSCLTGRPRKNTDEVELAAKRIVDAAQYYIFNYVDHTYDQSTWGNVKSPTDINDDSLLDYDISIYEFSNQTVYARKSLETSINYDDPTTYEVYTTDLLKKDLATFSLAFFTSSAFNTNNAWKLPLFANMLNVDTCSFEEVGLKAVDDYTLRFFFSQKINVFDLQFALTSNFLVKTDLYKSLMVKNSSSGMYTTAYGTDNASNYMSYGPYKLETFQKDKAITLVKNENWYGYHDNNHLNLYQCDKISTTIVANHASQRQLFLAGQLDSLDLQNSDMTDFSSSKRVKFVPESYTQKISLNSDRTKLKDRQNQTSDTNDNKTLLNNLKFRTALSLSINRKTFASLATAGSQAFYGLLNGQYMINSQTGEKYRDTEQGKSVYNKVYKELGGAEGGEILNEDEIAGGYTDSRSGYNKTYAIKLVKEAIEEESYKEDGYRNGQYLSIDFLTATSPDESETTRDALNYLETAFNEVCNPNGIEVKIKAIKDEDYYNTAGNGNYDKIYSIWGGAANNPYGMMQVYIDPNFSKNCEYGFKGHQGDVNLEIEFSDGTKQTKSFYAWFDDIVKNYVEPSKNEGETWTSEQEKNYNKIHTKRLDILAGVEAGVLSRFEAIPLVAKSQASMNSFKVEDGAKTYVTFIGYGGIREFTFNYSDSEWKSFLGRYNNNLTDLYKQ